MTLEDLIFWEGSKTDPDPRMVQKESYKGRLNKACGISGLAFKRNQFVDRTIEITWR